MDCFLFYASKLYQHVKNKLDLLFSDSSNGFERPFSPSIFPTTTFNLGLQVTTVEHFDSMNLPYGWITLTSFGHYDSTKGGYLILSTLGLIIQFPAGSTILFPSSVTRHSNTPIQGHETRLSFTQLIPGGLFHYIDYNFQLKKVAATKDKILFQKVDKEENYAWEKSINLFSYYNELPKDRLAFS